MLPELAAQEYEVFGCHEGFKLLRVGLRILAVALRKEHLPDPEMRHPAIGIEQKGFQEH